MKLKDVLAKNLQMIAEARGLSSRSMSMQCGMPQKTVYNMMHGKSAAQVTNIDKLAAGLNVAPELLLIDGLNHAALMSIKSTRMMGEYLSLPAIQRARADALVKSLMPAKPEEPVKVSDEYQAVMGF